MIPTHRNTIMVVDEVSHPEIGLRDRHPRGIHIIDMPAFGFVMCRDVVNRKIIIVAPEVDIRLGVVLAVATPRNKKFSLIVRGVFILDFYLILSGCYY